MRINYVKRNVKPALGSSKWHSAASLQLAFSCSIVSASVKILSLIALAIKPPSVTCSIKKIISGIATKLYKVVISKNIYTPLGEGASIKKQ